MFQPGTCVDKVDMGCTCKPNAFIDSRPAGDVRLQDRIAVLIAVDC